MSKADEGFRIGSSLAYILIALFVLMASTTSINQTICIVQNLGWMAKPEESNKR